MLAGGGKGVTGAIVFVCCLFVFLVRGCRLPLLSFFDFVFMYFDLSLFSFFRFHQQFCFYLLYLLWYWITLPLFVFLCREKRLFVPARVFLADRRDGKTNYVFPTNPSTLPATVAKERSMNKARNYTLTLYMAFPRDLCLPKTC